MFVPRYPKDCARYSRVIGTTRGREALGLSTVRGVGASGGATVGDDDGSVVVDKRLGMVGNRTESSGFVTVVPVSL